MAVLFIRKGEQQPQPPQFDLIVRNALHGHAVESPVLSATPPAQTALALAAASLQPGQCVRFGSIAEAILEPDESDILKYGSQGVWDPIRHQSRYIGRRESVNFRYRGLVYEEATHNWSSDWPLWTDQPASNGHGYKHNAINPANGDHYFREYDSQDVHRWNGTWTLLPALGTAQVAGGLEYHPTLGLIYNDRQRIKKLGANWTEIANFGQVSSAYHAVSAYNPNSGAFLFGGGNPGPQLRMMDAGQNITDIPTPPVNPGSSDDHGVFTHDPSGDGFIVWGKATNTWAHWEPGDSSWQSLTQSAGSGATPQTGTPNLDAGGAGRACIAIPISNYGVIKYLQSTGAGANVWLYNHSRP